MPKHVAAMITAVMVATLAPCAVAEAAADFVIKVALLDMSAVAGGSWSASGEPGPRLLREAGRVDVVRAAG